MATSLFDAIQSKLQKPKEQGVAPIGGPTEQTQNIANLMAAKSGKATGGNLAGTGPRISNVGERLANQQTRLGGQQLAQQGQLESQSQQMANEAQTQQFDIQGKQYDEKQLDQQEQFTRQADAITNNLNREGKQLDFKKQAALMEQAGFNLRLANDKYVNNLQSEGQRARLDNGLKFQEELTKSIFSDEADLFENDLNFRSALRKDERSFTEDMANMDLDFAMEVANAANKQANQQMMWTGAGTAFEGGLKGYSAVQSQPKAPPKPAGSV